MAAGLVGVAMVAGLAFAFAAERAHASQLSELVELFIALGIVSDDKVDEAREAVAAMEETTPSTPSLATTMSCSFTRNLSTGATGQDVMDLQKLLNAKGFMVAAAGAGSPGMETSYYGPATAAAVAAMQTAFASEILAPLGLTTGTGYFGASTRAKANALCTAAPTTPEVPTVPEVPGDEDEDMDTTDEDTELSGEASLDTFEINSADDSDIEEGAEDAVVAEATAVFADGDGMITRLDVSIDDGPTGTDAWDVLDSVSLWVDGEKVAEKAADNKKDYLSESNGTLRFTGLDIVGMEDEEVVIEVAVTVMNNVDTGDQGDFNVSVDSMRYVDGDDVTTTESDMDGFGDTVSFNIGVAGGDDELIVKTSSSDPDAATIKIESDAKSDWVTVFVFDLDTKDSVNDIELTTVPVTVSTPATSTYGGLIDDARLVIDGKTIDSSAADLDSNFGASSSVAIINFDVDGDVTIDAGDRVKAELQLRFRALVDGDEGATVQGSVTSVNADAIVAEGADDLETNQLSGAATGDVHTLRTTGIYAEAVSDSAVTTVKDSVADTATFVFKFDVTAFEQDASINNAAFRDSSVLSGIVYEIQDSNGVATTTGTVDAVVSSTADEVTSEFLVDEGGSETFTVTVTFTPAAGYGVNSSYRMRVVDVNYASVAGGTVSAYEATPVEDFRTDYVNIGA
jgi:peptidoglycan hydrolase-like protein with peptidoglycan-binding domain